MHKTMSVHWLKAGWILLGGMESHKELGEPHDILWEERCSGEELIWNLELSFSSFEKEKKLSFLVTSRKDETSLCESDPNSHHRQET